MKIYSIILFIALSILGANAASAQTAEDIRRTEQSIQKRGKYALLVMKAQHLKAAILTGFELKSKNAEIDFQIVACGELVKQISTDKTLKDIAQEAVNKNGLKILVCGLSIQQFEVDKTLLPEETPVTDNGLIYLFGLQEQGYKTVIL